MTIQVIKLSNGDTIITDVAEATERVLTVINPLEISKETVSNLTNRMNLIAYSWMPMEEGRAENVMYVHKHHVVGLTNATTEMKEYYNEAVNVILYPERESRNYQEEEDLLELIKEYANTEPTPYH